MRTNLAPYAVYLGRWCLYAVIFTPFFVYRYTIFPFITLHTLYFEAITLLAFLCFVFLALFEPRFRPKATPLFLAEIGLLLALFGTAFFGEDVARSLWSNPERMLGTFAYLFFFAYYLALTSFLRAGEIKLQNYLRIECVVALIVASVACYQYFKPTLFWGLDLSERVGSFWGNPTYLAAYLIFNFFITLWLFVSEEGMRRWLFLGAAVIETTAIFLSQTRGEILGLLAGIVFLLSYFALRREEKDLPTMRVIKKASIAALAVLILFGVVFIATRDKPFWLQVPGLNRLARLSYQQFIESDRYLVFKIAWKGFLDKPLTGYGPENFVIPFARHYDPELLRFGKGHIFDKPHNIFLEYLSTSGLIGFFAYLGMIGAAFFSIFLLRAPPRPFFAAALLGYLVQNMVAFDVLASLLMLFMSFACIDFLYSPQTSYHPARKKMMHQFLFAATEAVLGCAVCYIFIFLPLYRSYLHFWAEFEINRKDFKAAKAYFDRALSGRFNLYSDAIYWDMAGSLNLILRSGLVDILPSPKENIAEAVEGIKKAVSQHPQNVFYKLAAINLLNSAFAVTRDDSYAALSEKMQESALQLSPQKQEIYYAAIELLMLKGKFKEAEDVIEKVIHLTKADYAADAHYLLGVIRYAQGRQKEAALAFREAIAKGYVFEIFSQARAVADRLGDAGYYDDAIDLYRRALQLNPKDLESQLKIGVVYYLKGDLEEARKILREIADMNPNLKNIPGVEQNFLPIFSELGIKL